MRCCVDDGATLGFSGELSPKTSLEGSTYFCHSSEGSISMSTGVTMLIWVSAGECDGGGDDGDECGDGDG